MQLIHIIPNSTLYYLILGCLLFMVMRAYIFVAWRYGIFDIPNERSSHQQPTVSAAGLLFPFAAVIWFVLSGMQHTTIIAAMLLLTMVSFIDDVKHVNARLRVLFHFIAAGLLILVSDFDNHQWYTLITSYLLIVGYINAGNFMDGINGMTAFFHLVTLGSFILMEQVAQVNLMIPVDTYTTVQVLRLFPEGLVEILFISVLVFAFFNARKKALVFAGDAGSISLSFIVAWLMIQLMMATGNFFWILLIATYGIDTTYTMVVRLRGGQKPLEAHRKHLHHLLVDVKRYPHVIVSAAYAVTQLIINALTVWMITAGTMTILSFLMILFVLIAVYGFFRGKVVTMQPNKNTGLG